MKSVTENRQHEVPRLFNDSGPPIGKNHVNKWMQSCALSEQALLCIANAEGKFREQEV